VTNLGNAATTISFAVGSPYYSVGTADGGGPVFTLEPGLGVTPVVTFSPTAAQNNYPDTITVTPGPLVPLCATTPANIPLSGSAPTGVTLSTTDIEFGFLQCGQSPTPAYRTLTITNNNAATTFTPNFGLGAGTFYRLEDNTGTLLPQGSPVALGANTSATLRVVPNVITPPASIANDAFSDTLTFQSPGVTLPPVTLNETAQGAILFVMPGNLSATSTQGTTTQPFTVNNSGNLAATYSLSIVPASPANASTFTTNILPGTTVPAATGTTAGMTNGEMTFVPPTGTDAFTQYTGMMTIVPATTAVLCAQVPGPTDLMVQN